MPLLPGQHACRLDASAWPHASPMYLQEQCPPAQATSQPWQAWAAPGSRAAAHLIAAGVHASPPPRTQAGARICKTLGQDFLPYLQLVMPPLLAAAQLKPDVIVRDEDDEDDEDDDGEVRRRPRGHQVPGARLAQGHQGLAPSGPRLRVQYSTLRLRVVCARGVHSPAHRTTCWFCAPCAGLCPPCLSHPWPTYAPLGRVPQTETFIVGGKRVSLHTSVLDEKATGGCCAF